ncbi:hypothetical protein HK100_005267 [Physocladia obscura]|uniref:Protein kinase domain-containing protein n=1 Tax=Physocladia obscura TaxID=109957 RepID=A0AAD5XGH3_9FUNG|nr:hypothetical protein HK100_005267 [Physocladia obscura]
MGCGSVRYMAPECFHPNYVSTNPNIKQFKDKKQPGAFASMSSKNGYPPASSDVWALGVILINLLFAKNPWFEAHPSDPIFSTFVSSNPNILRQQFSLSPYFDASLRRCFDLDPRRRCSVHDLKILVENMPHFVGDCVPAFIDPHGPSHDLLKDKSAALKRNHFNSPKLKSDKTVSSRDKNTPGLIIPPGVSIPLEQIQIIFDRSHDRKSSVSKPLSLSSNSTIITDEIVNFIPSKTVNSHVATSQTSTSTIAPSNSVIQVITASKSIAANRTTSHKTRSFSSGVKQTEKFNVHQQQLLQQPILSNAGCIKSDDSSSHLLNIKPNKNYVVQTTTMLSENVKIEITGDCPYSDVAKPDLPLNLIPNISEEDASTSTFKSIQSGEVTEIVLLADVDKHKKAVQKHSIEDDHKNFIQISCSETSKKSASGRFLMGNNDALKEIIIARSDTDVDDYEVVHNDFYDEWEWETI